MAQSIKRTNSVVNRIFFSVLSINIIAAFAPTLNTAVDCLVISRFIGGASTAVTGLLFPFNLLTNALATLCVTGTGIVCSKLIGAKNIKEADKIYWEIGAILLSIAVAASLVLFFAPYFVAGLFCFGNNEMGIHQLTSDYLSGYAFSIPAIVLGAYLLPILQIKGERIGGWISLAILAITNWIGDLVSVLWIGKSMYYIAMATTVSQWLSFLVLLFFLRRCNRTRIRELNLSLGEMAKDFRRVAVIGGVNASIFLMVFAYNTLLNNQVMHYGSVMDMSGLSVYNSIRNLIVPLVLGLASTTVTVVGFLRGEMDEEGIHFFRSFAARYTLCIVTPVAALIWLIAPYFVAIFTPEPAIQSSAILFLRCFCISAPLLSYRFFIRGYLQGLEMKTMSLFSSFLGEIAIVGTLFLLLGKMYDLKGLAAALIVAEMIFDLLCIIYLKYIRKRNISQYEKLMCYRKIQEKEDEFSTEATVSSIEDVMEFIQKLDTLGKEKNCNQRILHYGELAVEEIGTHILHEAEKKVSIDIRYAKKNGHYILSMRDTGGLMNPYEWENQANNANLHNSIAFRLLGKFAKSIVYTTAFHFNCYTYQLEE
ncbi:MAG: MATE family efflux transporter [Eubacteriales bacterium]|nr:MATE family efflux transporter [Eubacteriales bacterium]